MKMLDKLLNKLLGEQLAEWLESFSTWILIGEFLLIVGMLAEIYFGCEFFQRSGAFLVLYAIVLAIFTDSLSAKSDAALSKNSVLSASLLGSQLKAFILYFKVIDKFTNSGFIRKTHPLLDSARENINDLEGRIHTDSDFVETALNSQIEGRIQLKIFEAATATIGTIVWAFGDLFTRNDSCYFSESIPY